MEEEKITTPASEETEPQVISPEESTVAEDVVSEDVNTGKKEKSLKTNFYLCGLFWVSLQVSQ